MAAPRTAQRVAIGGEVVALGALEGRSDVCEALVARPVVSGDRQLLRGCGGGMANARDPHRRPHLLRFGGAVELVRYAVPPHCQLERVAGVFVRMGGPSACQADDEGEPRLDEVVCST